MRRLETDFGADFPFTYRKPHVLAPVERPTDTIRGRAKRRSEILNVAAAATFGLWAEEQTMNCEFGVAFSEREQSAASCRSVAGDVPLLSRAPNRFREDTTPCGFPSSAGRPKNIETRSFRLRRVDYFLIRHKVTMPCDEKSEFLPKTAKKFLRKGLDSRIVCWLSESYGFVVFL